MGRFRQRRAERGRKSDANEEPHRGQDSSLLESLFFARAEGFVVKKLSWRKSAYRFRYADWLVSVDALVSASAIYHQLTQKTLSLEIASTRDRLLPEFKYLVGSKRPRLNVAALLKDLIG